MEDEPDQEKAQSIGLDYSEEINAIYNISPQVRLRLKTIFFQIIKNNKPAHSFVHIFI